MWDLVPRTGIEPQPPYWEHRAPATGLPGKPLILVFYLFCCFCGPLQNPYQCQPYSICLQSTYWTFISWHYSRYHFLIRSMVITKPPAYQEQLQQQHQQKQQALDPWFSTPGWPGAQAAGSWAAHTGRFRISIHSDPIGCNRSGVGGRVSIR